MGDQQQLTQVDEQSNVVPLTSQTEADAMVSMIERVILNPEISMERVEKMIELKERFDDREAEKAFNKALAQALGEIPTIIKTGKVDFTSAKGRTHYTHETYDDIVKVVKPILSKYGLAFRYKMDESQGNITVTCVLSHEDGFSEKISKSGQRDGSGNKNALQGDASTQQYLMRYTLKAALGISVGADTDGATLGSDGAPTDQNGMLIPNDAMINEQQFNSLQRSIEDGRIDKVALCTYLQIPSLKEMPLIKLHTAMSVIEAKRGKS